MDTLIHNLDGELHGAAGCAGAAYDAALAAIEQTRNAVRQAAGAGFPGIASRLDGIVAKLERFTQGAMTAAVDAFDNAAMVVKPATGSMTVNEITANLGAGQRAVEAAVDKAASAKGEARGLAGDVRAALDGARPGQILSSLDDIDRQLHEAIKRASSGNSMIGQAAESIKRLGHG